MSLDGLKPSPIMDTVRFESEPAGAEAKTSNGQSCRTPCALALPVSSPLTVTFTLNGYLPESETIDLVTGNPTVFRPNPVLVELSPAPAQQKPGKKPPAPAKKKAAAKPAAAARPKPATAAAPADAPAQQQPAAPWPSAPPAR